MKTIFIQHKGSKLACIKFGEGPKAMLCFHGYGLDKNSFLPFEEKYGSDFTLYAFDLFAHGRSEYAHGEMALSTHEWNIMLENFLTQEDIDRFSILAFSMGGKVALCTYETLASRIDQMILIAPDGIKTSFWYQTATYPGLLNTFFRYTIFHPNFYFKTIKLLKWLHLADKGILKFVENEMNTAQKRARVYFSWMIYRDFKPDLKYILQLSELNKTPFVFYTGKFDKIIKTREIYPFYQNLKVAKLIELDSGHTQLIKDVSIFKD